MAAHFWGCDSQCLQSGRWLEGPAGLAWFSALQATPSVFSWSLHASWQAVPGLEGLREEVVSLAPRGSVATRES